MAYSFEQLLAADPSNPSNIAQNGSITIFAPGDPTMTPLTITDPDGSPLPNPFTVNANGFGPAFAHATLDRVAWSGGGFTGFVTSYEGMKEEAVAARAAAESAAATAGAEATAVAEAAIAGATDEATAAKAAAETAASNASASATAAANSAALVGAPADSAIAAAVSNSASATKAALNATYADKYSSAATAANTRRLVGKLRRAVADASILVISDSTGNSTGEWVYLTAQSIAAQFPAWGVQVAFWNETTNTEYQAPTVVQPGTNGRMLTIWNCAKSGEVPGYVLGFRWPTAVSATNPDLVFVSHGHNMGDSSGVAWQDQAGRNDLMSLTEEIAATFPRAGIVLIAQNPSKMAGRETWQAFKANAWEELASLRGYGFIDVHQAFLDYGNWQADLMQDDTHPNAAGSIVWASAVSPAFKVGSTPASMVLPPPPLLGQAKNYLVNGDFSAWTGAAPDSWALTLATASKDTTNFETGAHGMKLTASATSGTAYAEQAITLTSAGHKHLQGQVMTAAARVFVPAGNTATVRVTLLDTTGSANARETSVSASTRNRFVWVFASKRLADNAGGVYLRLTARTSGTATVEATFDRATLVRGLLPSEGVTAIKGDTGASGATGSPGLESASAFDFLSTLGTHPMASNALASGGVGVSSANEANLLPVKPQRNMTVTRLRWVAHTPSGNYDIGIYDAAGNRLWSKGATVMASGQITETVSPSVTLTAGNLYYIAFAIDNTTGLVRGNTSQGGMTKLATGAQSAVRVGVSMPLPATITPGTTETVRFQMVTVGEA